MEKQKNIRFNDEQTKAIASAVIDAAYEWLTKYVTYKHPRTGETKCIVNCSSFKDGVKSILGIED